MNLEQMPQKARYLADVGSWGAVLTGFFSDWSPVMTGVAAILASVWTGIQIYDWAKKKL